MGWCNVIRVGDLRIGGISGIYKPHDFEFNHFERVPFTPSQLRSVYHTRSFDVWRMSQVTSGLDIVISHDWPQGIERSGDVDTLLRLKPFFGDEIATNTLGSPPLSTLLDILQPRYWLSAHLHVHFTAKKAETTFLALDKPGGRRKFLEFLDFPNTQPVEITLDKEWLAVLKVSDPYFSLKREPSMFPESIEQEIASALLLLEDFDLIPPTFQPSHPSLKAQGAKWSREQFKEARSMIRNPQTVEFLSRLAIPYKLDSHVDKEADEEIVMSD